MPSALEKAGSPTRHRSANCLSQGACVTATMRKTQGWSIIQDLMATTLSETRSSAISTHYVRSGDFVLAD